MPPAGPKVVLPVGEWSIRQKLQLLSCYLGRSGGFLKATQKAGERYYVDLFAGPGEVRNEQDPQSVTAGSPLIALNAGPPQFTAVHWIEKEAGSAASLRAHKADHPARAIRVYEGGANEKVDNVLRALPRNFPVFAFLDPRGPELEWRTLRKLAEHKDSRKIELLILFAYDMAIVRLMPHEQEKMVSEDLLDRFMPDPVRWRLIYERRAELTATEYRRAMLAEYVRGLKQDLGYALVPAPYPVATQDNHQLYFLIFATDHPAGELVRAICAACVPGTRGKALRASLRAPGKGVRTELSRGRARYAFFVERRFASLIGVPHCATRERSAWTREPAGARHDLGAGRSVQVNTHPP